VPHVPGNVIRRFWPGPRYVDWVGISGFNPGPARIPHRWVSFGGINRSRYLQLLRYHKPIMVSETASPEIGGDKALWVQRMFRLILDRYPKLGALVWFDSKDPKYPTKDDWRVDSSPEALVAFRAGLDDPHVLSAPSAMDAARRGS
jgi:hypothetical protein